MTCVVDELASCGSLPPLVLPRCSELVLSVLISGKIREKQKKIRIVSRVNQLLLFVKF